MPEIIKPLPDISVADWDEVIPYIRNEDINGVAFWMFEKINEYFDFDEADINEKRIRFINDAVANNHNSYEELFALMQDSQILERLEMMLHNHIRFMRMVPPA